MRSSRNRQAFMMLAASAAFVAGAQTATAQAKPATTQSKPTTTQSKPATTQSKPETTTQAKPEATQAKPEMTQAKPATAQTKSETGGFSVGYTDIGPAIGLGGINGASASFGGRFEHAIKTLPDLGNGVLGIQASFDYYSWSSNFVGYGWSYKYMPIGVTANYHFKLDERKIDPFIGAGLGYELVSCSSSGTGFGDCGYNSGIYFIGRAGARYFFSPKMSGYVDVGTGAAALNVGLMFKVK